MQSGSGRAQGNFTGLQATHASRALQPPSPVSPLPRYPPTLPSQDLMRGAVDTVNVVDACTLEGRQERLEGALSQLEACEKALQDYLETKRIAFPRFYFVAPAGEAPLVGLGVCCLVGAGVEEHGMCVP
jgi:hypothetical protein